MKIKKFPMSPRDASIGGVPSNVVAAVKGYTLISETQLTVGVAPVVIGTPVANTTWTFLIINRSGAAQILRTGFAPAFAAPNVGISVLVNEVIIWENITFPLSIVSNGAGALADTLVIQQSF